MNNKQNYGLIESICVASHWGFLAYTLSSESLWDIKHDMEMIRYSFSLYRELRYCLTSLAFSSGDYRENGWTWEAGLRRNCVASVHGEITKRKSKTQSFCHAMPENFLCLYNSLVAAVWLPLVHQLSVWLLSRKNFMMVAWWGSSRIVL